MNIIGNSTWSEFCRKYRDKLLVAPVVAEGWPHQCRCGDMTIVKYRGLYYCRKCGAGGRRFCIYKDRGVECSCRLPTHPWERKKRERKQKVI